MTTSDSPQQEVAVHSSPSPSSKRNEILIAAIGLVGVLATAVFSNWDKIFPPDDVVKAKFSGYQPTGDPQVELRYFTEITGMRDMLKQTQSGMLDHFRKQAESQAGADPEFVAKSFKIVEEEMATQYDEIMNVYVPIASKHLSVGEVQELNKFYSTPLMRDLISRKMPLINQEFLPAAMTQMQKSQDRVSRRIHDLEEAERHEERDRPPVPSK